MRAVWLVLISLSLFVHAIVAVQPGPQPAPSPCETAKESALPLPSTIPPEQLADYEKQVFAS